jgi:hypothetical protein
MHGLINVKSPNNNSKWQMGLNSAFKGLITKDGNNLRIFERQILRKISGPVHVDNI